MYYTIYVVEGMTGEQVLEALISRYARVSYNELFPVKEKSP